MGQTQKTFFTITTDIRLLLVSDDRLIQIIGDRVFPLMAPENTEGSFITYKREAYSRDQNKMGPSSDEARVYIVAVSDDYDESQSMAVIVNEILEGDHGDFECELIDSTEDFTEKKFIQVLLFKIY